MWHPNRGDGRDFFGHKTRKLAVTPEGITASYLDSVMYDTERIVVNSGTILKQKSESELTKVYSFLLFDGTGQYYLGWKHPQYRVEENGELTLLMGRQYDFGPRHWKVENSAPYWKGAALHEHLKGCFRGLVAHEDSGNTSVPAITADIDRHHGEDIKTHIVAVIKVGRLCKMMFPNLRWLVEVNPNNGSVKFFGFRRDMTIPMDEARQMAAKLHTAVVNITGNEKTEIFPHNCGQVLLPMRLDKSTIVTGGELAKVQRYKNTSLGREYFDTYSMRAFERWFNGRGQYDEMTLFRTLQRSCKQATGWGVDAADKPANAAASLAAEAPSSATVDDSYISVGSSLPQNTPTHFSKIANAFERKREFVLWLTRQMGHVPTLEETLTAYRQSRLYGGDWNDGLAKRKCDFKSVIKFVAKTFNAGLTSSESYLREELNQKIQQWKARARGQMVYTREFTTRLHQSRSLDEFGRVEFSHGRKRLVDGRYLPAVMGIVEHVRMSDGGIPRDVIQHWWEQLTDEGLLPNWTKETWLAYRTVLVQLGWIKMDHDYSRTEHRAKTCRITFGNGPTVGTICSYPATIELPHPSITMVAHGATTFLCEAPSSMVRPTSRGQPPPITHSKTTRQTQNSRNRT